MMMTCQFWRGWLAGGSNSSLAHAFIKTSKSSAEGKQAEPNMIEYYDGGPFGVRLIFRAHGSAVIKALIPATVSILVLYGVMHHPGFDIAAPPAEKERLIGHPYAVGALLAAFSFLIVFRANFAYARFWEGCQQVHQMHSKWTDMATCLAAFHYQSSLYSKIRPPAFGQHESLQHDIQLGRELNPCTPDEMRQQLDEMEEKERNGTFIGKVTRPIRLLSPMNVIDKSRHRTSRANRSRADPSDDGESHMGSLVSNDTVSKVISVSPRLDGGLQGAEPSLFLQEFAHLMSLMSAVAFSTLRGDSEGTEIPLIEYIPGTAWPPVDPDDLATEIRQGYHSTNRLILNIRWLFGLTRGKKEKVLYNAARPLRVLGGVSDAEMHMLMNARGPSAKVALCSLWLNEFVTREHLSGSTNGVAAPIISRLYQYCSDGMVGFHQARKIAYTPFPFPHAQVTTLFVAVVVFFMPVLMYSFVNSWWLAYLLDFFTVLCFVSLHMVARELENPFTSVPNDLPLPTLQVEFNEALVSMFAGYNPDSWWELPKKKGERKEKKVAPKTTPIKGSIKEEDNGNEEGTQENGESNSTTYGAIDIESGV